MIALQYTSWNNSSLHAWTSTPNTVRSPNFYHYDLYFFYEAYDFALPVPLVMFYKHPVK